MSWTKRQFVTEAFDSIGLAGYVFDLQPEQLQSALRKLDSMMATWNAKGIRLGYPLPSSPQDSDLDEETNVPDSAFEAVYANLALKIAPSFGKQVAIEVKVAAKQAYDTLLQRATAPIEKQLPSTMPLGAGKKPWRFDDPFVLGPKDQLTAGANDLLEIPGIESTVNLDNEFILTQPKIVNNITNITLVTPLTWSDYMTRWDTPPVQVGAATLPVAGDVYEYVLQGVSRYRLVPTTYDPQFDAFYTSFAGGVLAGLIVARNQ